MPSLRRAAVTVVSVAALVLGASLPALAGPAPVATNGDVLFERGTAEGGFLYRIQPDGTDRREIRQLTTDPHHDWRGVGISPEGRRLLFWRSAGDRVVLTVTNVDGTSPADIASFDDIDNHPLAAWSADGREVAVVHRNRLYTVPADGSDEPERRPQNLPVGRRITDLQWHPDGDRILLTMLDEHGELVLWSVDRDGGDHDELVRMADTAGPDFGDLRLSPDGTEVAYRAHRPPPSLDCREDEFGIIDLASGDRRVVATDDELGTCQASGTRWAPDGRQLVFEGYLYEAGQWIYRLDVETGATQRLTGPREGVGDDVIGWAPRPDLLGRACPTGEVPDAGFVDTAGTAHARGIDCAAWWEIAAGRTDGTYGPGAPVTRAQMASFVARTLQAVGVELPEVTGSRFDDVDASSVHGPSIEQLAELGIVDGVTPDTYAPGRVVTRAQMARFLVGAYELAADQQLPTLPDAFVDDDGSALESSVNAVASVGLASGVETSRYAPGAPVNRGQMATFLSRLVDRLARDLDLPVR